VRREGWNLLERYAVEVYPMRVQLSGSLDAVMTVTDGHHREAVSLYDGVGTLFIMPGQHTVAVFGADGREEYLLGSGEVYGFSATVPVELPEVDGSGVTVVIELAGVERDLRVLLNGEETDLQPQAGKITLSPLFAGMTVTVSCDRYTEDITVGTAAQQEIAVQLLTQMEQQNPDDADRSPQAMTDRRLVRYLAQRFYTYYESYLKAINEWDEGQIVGLDPASRAAVVEKMKANNEGYLFRLNEIVFDAAQMKRGQEDGRAVVELVAEVDYDYSYRSDSTAWYAGGNRQRIRMVYDAAANEWNVLTSGASGTVELGETLIRLP